jgi:hypothetical protein
MTVVQVAWGALALLAVAVFGMFGMFFYLGQKIDGTNKRIDDLGASLGARIDALGARLDAHVERNAS